MVSRNRCLTILGNTCGVISLAMVALLGSSVTCGIARNQLKTIKPYVESHMTDMIKAQERELDLKHLGIPKISYNSSFGMGNFDPFPILLNMYGAYNPETDTISLPSGLLTVPGRPVESIFIKIINPARSKSAKSALDHELGHFYTDKLSESLGNGDWPALKDYAENIGVAFVSEGIATYFEKEMNGADVFYLAQYEFVKPIIDQYGERGIRYLMENIPSEEELSNPQQYQLRALDYLQNSPRSSVDIKL